LTQALLEVLDQSKTTKCDKKTGALLYNLASRLASNAGNRRSFLAVYIGSNKLINSHQLDIALAYIRSLPIDVVIDEKVFDAQCGIGVEVSPEEVRSHIQAVFSKKASQLKELRYAIMTADYIKEIREGLPFASGQLIVAEFNSALKALLGEETEEDKIMASEQKKQKGKKEAAKSKLEGSAQNNNDFEENEPRKKITDLIGRDMDSALNT